MSERYEVRCLYDHDGNIFHVDHDGATRSFLPDSQSFWEAIKESHASGRLLGVAHTHPEYEEARPSQTDLNTFAAVDQFLGDGIAWLIVTGRYPVSWNLRRKGHCVSDAMEASMKVVEKLHRFVRDQLDAKDPDPRQLLDVVSASDACATCGACCNFGDNSFHVLGVNLAGKDVGRVPPGLTTNFYEVTNRLPSLRRHKPRATHGRWMIWHDNKCIAHHGEVGVSSSCSIYKDRPTSCREVPVGDPLCVWSRQMAGMSPAAPRGSFASFVRGLYAQGRLVWTPERLEEVASGAEPTGLEYRDLGKWRWGSEWVKWARNSELSSEPLDFPVRLGPRKIPDPRPEPHRRLSKKKWQLGLPKSIGLPEELTTKEES